MTHGRTVAGATPGETLTLDYLESIPPRALEFLRGLATTAPARHALVARSYTKAEHDLGWKLLLRASGHDVLAVDAPEPDASDAGARDAIATLTSWVGPHVRMIDAALARKAPAQRAFVMAGLGAATGAAAVVAVGTLLERLDALEHGPHGERHAPADHAALALLAGRGIDAAERARLAGLVNTAKALGDVSDVAAPEGIDPATHEADLRALYDWFHDWTTTARTVIKRRDYLIRLGLSARGKPTRAAPAPDPSATNAASDTRTTK